MNNTRLLSLCIPTNGAVQFVVPVLESIYSQKVDDSLFEVVITDNGKNSVLENAIWEYKSHCNLYYYKSELQGFVNQVDSFKRSNGLYIKMLNHRAKLLPGALDHLICLVRKYQTSQPCIYCTDGVLKKKEYSEYIDFDEFVKNLSFYSSWSAGVGIWQKDKPMLDKIEYNRMFPHASILFETRDDSEYVIWNHKFMDMKDEPTKGGYNIFHTFAVVYLDLMMDLVNRKRISSATFNVVRNDLLDFLSGWYYLLCLCSSSYTFDTTNLEEYMHVYYTKIEIFYFKFNAWMKYKSRLKDMIKKVLKVPTPTEAAETGG